MKQFDFLVLGSGIAGLTFALKVAPRGRVAIQPNGGGEWDWGGEGGHSKRRILHAKDVTGREIERALLAAIARQPNILIFENHLAIDLIPTRKRDPGGTAVPPVPSIAANIPGSRAGSVAAGQKWPGGSPRPADRCAGVYVLDKKTGKVGTVVAPVGVLATGGVGAGGLFTPKSRDSAR